MHERFDKDFRGTDPSMISSQIDNTVDSIYFELEIEREKQVTAYTKGPRLEFEIESCSRQRVVRDRGCSRQRESTVTESLEIVRRSKKIQLFMT